MAVDHKKLRKLKDAAAKYLQKGKIEKALEAYINVLKAEPKDLSVRLKVGDLLRKSRKDDEAIEAYQQVARAYATDGLLLKAIAVSKLILEVDPSHTDTQEMLAQLYARKSGRSRPAPAPSYGQVDLPPAEVEAAPEEPEPETVIEELEVIEPEPEAIEELPAEALEPVAETEPVDDLDAAFADEAFSDLALDATELETVEDAVTDIEIEIDLSEVPDVPQEPVKEEELPTIPLFSDLPKNAFIQLLHEMSMRNVARGETIIREGEVDDKFFIISDGKVKVTKMGEDGREITLAFLGDGAFFGEMAILSDTPRTATVVAEADSHIFEVSRQNLDEVIEQWVSVRHVLHRFYKQRLLANLMATSPIFQALSREQRKDLIEKFKSREVAAQEHILSVGDKAAGLYLILAGRVEVSAPDVDGGRNRLAHLKEGDIFGEMELLTNSAINADVVALSKCIILRLPKKVFNVVVSTHPQVLAHISELADERARATKAIEAGELEFTDEGLVLT